MLNNSYEFSWIDKNNDLMAKTKIIISPKTMLDYVVNPIILCNIY